VWATPGRGSINSLDSQARVQTWTIIPKPQVLDENAGGAGVEVEIRVFISYRQDKNTDVEAGSAITRVTAATMKEDADTLIADAQTYGGLTGMLEIQARQYFTGDTGSSVTAMARGITSVSGVISWLQTLITERQFPGSVERLADGSDVLHTMPGGDIVMKTLSYEIKAHRSSKVSIPTLAGVQVLRSAIADDVLTASADTVEGETGEGTIVHAGTIVGRVLAEAGAAAGGLELDIGGEA
jgi:hypothetical protein